METKTDSETHIHLEQDEAVDYQPLIDLFELLLEWDIKDVQEKAEQRKEVS